MLIVAKTAKLGLFHKIHHKNVELDFKRDFDLTYATIIMETVREVSISWRVASVDRQVLHGDRVYDADDFSVAD